MKDFKRSAADRQHTLLPAPWNYEVVGLRIELAPEYEDEPFLDLTLRLDGVRRRLRFHSPTMITIEEDGLNSYGLEIVDVSARHLDGLGVLVDSFEADPAIRFWARDVVEIDASGE